MMRFGYDFFQSLAIVYAVYIIYTQIRNGYVHLLQAAIFTIDNESVKLFSFLPKVRIPFPFFVVIAILRDQDCCLLLT